MTITFHLKWLILNSTLFTIEISSWMTFIVQGYLIIYINSLRSSVTELGSVTEGRPGPARHSRTPGFPPTGPAVGGAGPGPSQKAGRLSSPLHGWNGHNRSLVPSTGGGAWLGGGALRCCRWEKRRRRTEERREEKSVAWRRSTALLQVKEEEEEDGGEKRREILIGADQDQDLCCDFLVFSNKKFCLWFSLAGVTEETKSWSKSLAEVVVVVLKHATSQCPKVTHTH